MERVAFLVEPGGRRIECLLNPEGLTVTRRAGVERRRSPGGAFVGRGLSDDPIAFTGGGATELDLDLLFDVELARPAPTSPDVRALTRPLWELTENAAEDGRYGRPPTVRFVWGKRWNVPGVLTAAAERFERFDSGGAPARSWMRVHLVRVPEPPAEPEPDLADAELLEGLHEVLPDVLEGTPSEGLADPPDGAAALLPTGPGTLPRLDLLAWRLVGNPGGWREIARRFGLDHPLRVDIDLSLRLRIALGTEEDPA